MGFEKVEFEFPEEGETEDGLEIEDSTAIEINAPEKKKPKVEDDEDDLEIEVVDDTPEKDRGRKAGEAPQDVTDEELESYSEKVRKRIQHFSKGYHDERRAKETAFRERQELETLAKKLYEENDTLKGTAGKNQTMMLDQAKRTVASELEQAKKKYKDAYEAGDSDAVVDAQDALTTARLRADKLANFKAPPLQEGKPPVQQELKETTQRPIDPDQRAISWQKENTWFGSDEEMTSLALGLHNKLVKEGIDPKSDTYYERIDSRMRKIFPEQFGEPEPSKKQSNVVAPATRSKAPRKVKLTQTQVAIAKRLGVPLELYAKQVAEDMRNEQ